MKLLLSLLLISTAYAKESCVTSSQEEQVQETKVITTDVPNHLKGAKIIVRLANGKESEVPAELFKVVPRKQERIVTKVATNTTKVCQNTIEKLNRISLLAGHGQRGGMSKSVTSTKAEFETKVGAVGGLQYQRLLNEHLSIGVQGQTNNTGSLMIGLDF